jgi:NTP pyrophosphatase (non-canonical NTP hydrolase)
MDNIVKEIGLPALAEQCAEECTELAHACLKMARKLRGENITPKQYSEIRSELKEEIADVNLLISMICTNFEFDADDILTLSTRKYCRWLDRIEEHKKQEE